MEQDQRQAQWETLTPAQQQAEWEQWNRRQQAPYGQYSRPPEKVKKGWRKLTWFILAVQALFIIWLIVGLNDASHQTAKQCAGQQATRLCHDASNAGSAIGAALVIGLWVAVDIILGLIWLITNRDR